MIEHPKLRNIMSAFLSKLCCVVSCVQKNHPSVLRVIEWFRQTVDFGFRVCEPRLGMATPRVNMICLLEAKRHAMLFLLDLFHNLR